MPYGAKTRDTRKVEKIRDVMRKAYKPSNVRRGTSLSRFQRNTYGIRAKGCYADTRRGQEFYTETI